MAETGADVEGAEKIRSPRGQLAIIQESLDNHETFFNKLSLQTQEGLRENIFHRLKEKNDGGTYLEHRERLLDKDQMVFGLNVIALRFTQFPPFLLAVQKYCQPEIGVADVKEVLNALKKSDVKVKVFNSLSKKAQERGLKPANLVTVRVVGRQAVFNVLQGETKDQPYSPDDVLANLIHDMSAYLMEYTNCYGKPDSKGFFNREDRQFAATMLATDALLDTIDDLLNLPDTTQQ